MSLVAPEADGAAIAMTSPRMAKKSDDRASQSGFLAHLILLCKTHCTATVPDFVEFSYIFFRVFPNQHPNGRPLMDWQRLARANTHPLRISVLEVLALDGGRTLSPSDLSYELRVPLSNVNYHVTELLRSGLIELARERQVRGATEHFYRMVGAQHQRARQRQRASARGRPDGRSPPPAPRPRRGTARGARRSPALRRRGARRRGRRVAAPPARPPAHLRRAPGRRRGRRTRPAPGCRSRAGHRVAGRASDGVRPPWARRTAWTTFSGSGPDIRNGRAGDPEELAQRRGVRLEAVGQKLVAHALEAHQLRVVGEQVEERRLDQGQRPHLCRPARRRDQRAERAVGVRDDVGASIEQRSEVGGVDIEVLAPVRGRRTGREAAPVDGDQRPTIPQGRERRPGRRRAGAAVHEQHLRPLALADRHDLIRHRRDSAR